jgi:ubiquinone/menaquinone biosynthesis C-methylase UbiE
MPRRLQRRMSLVLLALAAFVALVAAQLPYLPLVHGTAADEVERLAAWLELRPGTRVADLGAGDGTLAVALARRLGSAGQVYATELDEERLAEIRRAVGQAGLSNVEVIAGAVSDTQLPAGCCDAVYSRNVYHHLTDPAAINASLFRALRPGGRLLIIDFEPRGIMNWIGRPGREGGHGTRREALLKEVAAAGFQVMRGPEPWRGRLYAVLFRRP